MFWLHSWFIIVQIVSASACEYYLAPSKFISEGRGVIAGIDYLDSEDIELGTVIYIPCVKGVGGEWQFDNYMYNSEYNDICIITTGIAMSINSHTSNSEHDYVREKINPSYQLYYHYNSQSPIAQYALNESDREHGMIGIGDEIFDHYGGTWFEDRGIIESLKPYSIEEHRYSDISELIELGVCASHVIIGRSSSITSFNESGKIMLVDAASPPKVIVDIDEESNIGKISLEMITDHSEVITTHKNTDQGTGLFAKKSFKKGELIIVSPVLMIPLHDAIETTKEPLEGYNGTKVTSILMNYLFVSSGSINRTLGELYTDYGNYNINDSLYSDVSLFAMGSGASANHRPSRHRVPTAVETANMEIEWFAFDTKERKSKSRYLNNDNYSRCSALDGGCGDEYIHYDVSKQEPDTILYDRLYKTDPNVVERHPFAPLDIAYRAERDIIEGEELFIDYGVEWEDVFAIYLQEMELYESRRKEGNQITEPLGTFVPMKYEKPPQFRCPLVFPDHLFPSWWVGVSCIGVNCDDDDSE